jgi:hypothetical protein
VGRIVGLDVGIVGGDVTTVFGTVGGEVVEFDCIVLVGADVLAVSATWGTVVVLEVGDGGPSGTVVGAREKSEKKTLFSSLSCTEFGELS